MPKSCREVFFQGIILEKEKETEIAKTGIAHILILKDDFLKSISLIGEGKYKIFF